MCNKEGNAKTEVRSMIDPAQVAFLKDNHIRGHIEIHCASINDSLVMLQVSLPQYGTQQPSIYPRTTRVEFES